MSFVQTEDTDNRQRMYEETRTRISVLMIGWLSVKYRDSILRIGKYETWVHSHSLSRPLGINHDLTLSTTSFFTYFNSFEHITSLYVTAYKLIMKKSKHAAPKKKKAQKKEEEEESTDHSHGLLDGYVLVEQLSFLA